MVSHSPVTEALVRQHKWVQYCWNSWKLLDVEDNNFSSMLLVSSLIRFIWQSSSYSCINPEYAWCKSNCFWKRHSSWWHHHLACSHTVPGGLDPRVEQVYETSCISCVVCFLKCSSHKISWNIHVFSFPKSLQLLIWVVIANKVTLPWGVFRCC